VQAAERVPVFAAVDPLSAATRTGSAGTVHLHHYIWGLALIAVCGFLALSLESAKWHPILAIPFGVGLALVLDEFALLLQLKDVYWA
jgi:hypothetical protein